MSTLKRSIPSLSPLYQSYNSPLQDYRVWVSTTVYYDFRVCKDTQNQDPNYDYVFKKGYCGNGGSTGFQARFKDVFDLSWSSDTNITNTTNTYFPVIQDSHNNYYVDWDNPFIPIQDYYYYDIYNSDPMYSKILNSGISFEYTEGSGSTVEPSDDPYHTVVSAIYTASAVPICLCFFFVIYKIFMRLRG